MERLTERNENGQAIIRGVESMSANEIAQLAQRLYDRLAEYEDTRMTPEQIRKMKCEMSWVGMRDMCS